MDDRESRFSAYVEKLVGVIGHADRVAPLRDYCLGLLMPGERKSVEPMAAVVAPARVAAKHQPMLHFVGQAPWSDTAVLAKVRDLVIPAVERSGPVEAWIIDDTGFPKKGKHSVGVARQYCGQLGKQDNCQIAVSLSLANGTASLPVAWRLYLPQEWADDPERRAQAGVPEDVRFRTKPQIALEQIRAAVDAGLPRCRSDGCGLWHRHRSADRHQRTRSALCRGCPAADLGLGIRDRAAAAAGLVRPWAADQAAPARCRAPACRRQGPGAQPSGKGVGDRNMARRQRRSARLALRPCPRSRRTPR